MESTDEYEKSLTKMTLEQLYQEADRITNTVPAAYDFSLVAQAEAVEMELKYRKYYEPQGYNRFQAGYLMFFT